MHDDTTERERKCGKGYAEKREGGMWKKRERVEGRGGGRILRNIM